MDAKERIVWKAIKGFNRYKINNLGQVCSFVYKEFRGVKILSPVPNSTGYLQLVIYDDNKKPHSKKIHRLIAEAFIPNPKNKPQINHKNGNPLDNRIENLEWCSQSENVKHAYDIGLEKKPFGELNGRHKLTLIEVNKIKELYALGQYRKTDLAKMFGVTDTTIHNIIINKLWNFGKLNLQKSNLYQLPLLRSSGL